VVVRGSRKKASFHSHNKLVQNIHHVRASTKQYSNSSGAYFNSEGGGISNSRKEKKLTDGMGKAFVSVLRVSELEIISPVPCNDDVH
jgi:hypothetical protein